MAGPVKRESTAVAAPDDSVLNDLNPNMSVEGGFEEDPDSELWDLNEDSGEDAPKYAPMPPGVYSVMVEDAEYYVSGNGNPTIKIQFSVYNSPNEQFDGRRLFYYITKTPANIERVKRSIAAIDPSVDFSRFNPSTAVQEFVGCCCRAKVRYNVYQNKRGNKVSDIIPPSEGEAAAFI